MEHIVKKFSSGLRLVMVPLAGIESVTVLVAVGAGSRDEPEAVAGISHFLEHMASKGTKKRPTPFEVASIIDDVGGEQNAATSKEMTEYWAKVDSAHLETAFDFLADNLLHSKFAHQEIERERQVIIEEINMYEDTPMRRVMDIFESLLYGKTPLGRDIAGKKRTVAAIHRAHFLSHVRKFYRASNMVIVVAGTFSQPKAISWTKKYFAQLNEKPVKDRTRHLGGQAKSRVKVTYKKTDQAHFCFGVPAVSYASPDRSTLSVLATILGGSRTSRIYRQIREERGWAYYVQTFPDYYTDTGSLITRAGVSLEKTAEAVKLVAEEHLRLATEKVPAQELDKAKSNLRGRFLLALEDSFNVASRAATEILTQGSIRTPEKVLAEVAAVTSVDVQRVAREYLRTKKFNFALIGPFRQSKKFAKLLA